MTPMRGPVQMAESARLTSCVLQALALLVMLPLMEAMRMILPGQLYFAICLPAACAVNRTPLVFTSMTCETVSG